MLEAIYFLQRIPLVPLSTGMQGNAGPELKLTFLLLFLILKNGFGFFFFNIQLYEWKT